MSLGQATSTLETTSEVPTISVKLFQLFESSKAKKDGNSPLQILYSSDELRAVISSKLKHIVKQVDEHINTTNEVVKELCDKYAIKDKDGEFVLTEEKNYQFEGENSIKFSTEYNELFNQDIIIQGKVITMVDIEDVKISSENLSVLEWLVKD